jgi:EmrB/QacA subfamily drug resistance transporter
MMEGAPVAEGAGGAPVGAPHPAVEISPRARFEVLGAILLALLLGALDQTIVGTALPRIVTDLHGNDLYTWAVTIYLLTSTISVPFYGKLSDYYGRKPLLLFGISVFLIGSALSGQSQNMTELIIFRGIQGIGAGALFPISLAVIGDLFTPAERGKYQGLFGAVFGFAALVGPFLGGVITDNFGWHWIFYINIPIGLVSLFVVARVLPSMRRPKHQLNLDWLGGAFFIAGMIPFLVGLTNKQTSDWGTFQVGGLMGTGLVLLAIFLAIEYRTKEAIVPLDLWRDRTYAGTIVATFFAAFGFFSASVFLPRLYQVVFGESATVSGWELMPLLIGVIGSSIISGQIVARTGRYKTLLLVSVALIGIGSFMFTHLTYQTDTWTIRFWQLVLGTGIGPTLAVFTIVIQNAVPFSKLGVATSNLTFFRQIGGVVGLSLAGSFFGSQLQKLVPEQLVANGVPAQMVAAFQGRGFDMNNLVGVGGDLGKTILNVVPPAFRAQVEPLVPNIVTSIYEAIALAIADIFWFGVVSAVIAFGAVLVIRELPLRSTFGPVREPRHAEAGGTATSPSGAPAGPAAAMAPVAAASSAQGPAGGDSSRQAGGSPGQAGGSPTPVRPYLGSEPGPAARAPYPSPEP